VSCELTESVLHGYLDGELDAARAAEFERHLLSCPQCVAALEAQEDLRGSIQNAGLYERAPETLRRSVRQEFTRPAPTAATTVAPIRATSRRFTSLSWLAVAATFLFAGILGWRLIPSFNENRGSAEIASAVVDAHLRSLQPGHLEDVVSTDQHTVKPWFDGKLDFAPPVHDFANDGFPLLGGRLDVVRGHTVAVLIYGRRKHLINVFVWPVIDERGVSGDQPRSGAKLGYNWIGWRKNGMEVYAVSDVAAQDLDALRQLLIQ
jgi:anti-sigma factor RsiW